MIRQTHTAVHTGRPLEYYTHISGKEYGYDDEREDPFAVLRPKDETPGKLYPFYVVFHSAGHDMQSTLDCMTTPGDHDIYHTPDDCFAMVPDCRLHLTTDWWWGGRDAHKKGPCENGTQLNPVEKRVLCEIEWAMKNFPVDPERVYAVGNSMGGSGALGIAFRRGDLFAAIKANVPAGVRHAADRCCFDCERPEGFEIPDPPVVIDYSAQNDDWSDGHEVLYRAARDHKYALMGFFGPFGHENDDSKINAVNDLVHSFDIRTVALHEAYPVFCGATTDDPIPWPDGKERTDAGQVNAFFRWKVIEDSADRFEIELRLLSPAEWKTRVRLPESSTAEVYFRRLQRFKFTPDSPFAFTYNGKEMKGMTDKNGVPAAGALEITQKPKSLIIKK
ncbi:MAG: hypothetical protein IJR90_00320 [Clostridia bacterium]|nr:hypothetical protein [Clostridia bacterium]